MDVYYFIRNLISPPSFCPKLTRIAMDVTVALEANLCTTGTKKPSNFIFDLTNLNKKVYY